MAAWSAKPDGIWWQLAGVLIGGLIMVAAVWPIPRLRTRPGVYLSSAFGEPLADFFGRFKGTAALILALICVYRLSDFVLNIMNPFYLDLGFSLDQVAGARKLFGLFMTMAGVFAGGVSVARLGVMRAMVIGAFALPITNTIFAWLATQGPDLKSLLIAIGIDNIVSGFAGTCLIAYMSSLTSVGFTATQYALFSSLYSLPGKLVASQSGRIVESGGPRGASRADRSRRCDGCSPTRPTPPSPTPWRSRTSRRCRWAPATWCSSSIRAWSAWLRWSWPCWWRAGRGSRRSGRPLAPLAEVALGAHQRQAGGDGLQFGAGIDLGLAEPLDEQPPHRRHEGRAAGQEHPVDLAGHKARVGPSLRRQRPRSHAARGRSSLRTRSVRRLSR